MTLAEKVILVGVLITAIAAACLTVLAVREVRECGSIALVTEQRDGRGIHGGRVRGSATVNAAAIAQLEADLLMLRKQLSCERDQEQRVLLQLDMARVAQQLEVARAEVDRA